MSQEINDCIKGINMGESLNQKKSNINVTEDDYKKRKYQKNETIMKNNKPNKRRR